ncbi:hypothetical protein [Flavobacterium sp.]|uniref:hypothetical protein n=1 Tax=Flavobacterium sp. TaxID=239 RepID=UPI003750BB12
MKNTITLKILLLLVLLFNSCTTTNNEEVKGDGLLYYQFTQDEKNKLILAMNVGNIIVFKNQNDEFVKFEVTISKTEKRTYTTGGFLGYVTKRFYYDEQQIVLKSLNNYTYDLLKIDIMKYPVGSDYQTQYPVIGTPKFYGFLEFPLWNGFIGTDENRNYISLDFEIPTTNMTVIGNTYTKVRKFESNKTTILNPTISLPFHPRNVQTVYYDYNFGIIGFDDLDGKIWRKQ